VNSDSMSVLNGALPFPQQVALYLAFTVGWYLIGIISPFFSKQFFKSYRDLKPLEKRDWDIRVVSNLHGFFQIILSFYYVPIYWAKFRTNPVNFVSIPFDIFLCGAAGYFTQDGILMAVYYRTPIFSWASMFHHIMAVFANLSALFFGHCATMVVLVGMEELSTPFVNQRWFLEAAHMKSHFLYALNGLFLWIVFTLIRVPFTYVLYMVLWPYIDDCLALTWWMQGIIYFSMVSSAILNVYWSALITKGLLKHVLGIGSGKSKAKAKAQKTMD